MSQSSFTFVPAAYGPTVAELLEPLRPMSLGAGRPDPDWRPRLAALRPEQLFEQPVIDEQMAAACLSGLWLYHDFLDESHGISQEIHTRTGSFWHGIMHRREPDFPNAKYWFRQVGRHEIYPSLAAAAAELAGGDSLEADAQFLLRQHDWDPLAFVDLVEAVQRGRSHSGDLCRQVQLCEWELLFDYCHRRAIG